MPGVQRFSAWHSTAHFCPSVFRFYICIKAHTMHVLDEFQRFLRFDRQSACVAARAVWLCLGIRSLCRAICGLVDQRILRFHNFDLAEILFGQCERQQLPAKRRSRMTKEKIKSLVKGRKSGSGFRSTAGVVLLSYFSCI